MGNSEVWSKILKRFKSKGKPREFDYLEIGSFEGMSAHYVLLHHPKATVTCIDTWRGSFEHDPKIMKDVFKRYLKNTKPFKDRVTTLKGRSDHWIPDLIFRNKQYDVVYIDGSHEAFDVIRDATLGWKILKKNGIMIFDDYEWKSNLPDEQSPKMAIASFLAMAEGRYNLLHRGYQIIVEKTSD